LLPLARRDGKVLYVGKAKDLKKRVSNYFQKRDHDPKTKSLIQMASSLDFIVTTSKSRPCLGKSEKD
jgi:excinuclease ABC subunit C